MEQQVKEFGSLVELLEDLDREGITGIDRARIVENFLMRKSRLHGKPYCASFELTPLCNFDCKMCYMHLTHEQMQREGRMLTTEEWLDIARQTVEMGVRHIDLTGGECLTHPGFEQIYTYLVNEGVHVAVLTNGQLITDRHVELFSKYRPSSVQISLYGSNPDAYLKVTGRDAFLDVMQAVDRLRAASIRVQMSITPHRFMQDNGADMLDLLHSLGVDYTIGSMTLPARPNTGRCIDEYIIDFEAYVELCKLETKHRQGLAEKYGLKQAQTYHYRMNGQEAFGGLPCAAGSANFHINWKGEMTPCVAFYSVHRSVLHGGMKSAWEEIRGIVKEYREPEECQRCSNRRWCSGCSAEKTSGVLNGALNTWVCRRFEATRIPTGTDQMPIQEC